MNYKNFSIKGSKGCFYQSFKEKVPGSTEVKVKNPSTGEELIRYHLETDRIEGILYNVKKEEATFDGRTVEQLKISITDKDGDPQVLTIPIMGTRGVTDWAIQAAYFLPQLINGERISLGLNTKDRDKSGKYLRPVMFFRQDDVPLKRSFTKEEVPAWEKRVEKDKVTKKEKEVWDSSSAQAFFYDVITEQCERLSSGSSVSNVPVTSDEDSQHYDDLPF